MKRVTLLFVVALFAALYPGSEMAFAQHAHGGGPGLSHGPSASSHRATASSSGSQGVASSSPNEVLTRNTRLDSTLTTKLQSKNLLPAGTDLKSACAGFRNLGQCMAAIHVSHNLNISFACMKADMTGQAPTTGSNCPTPTVAGSSKLSLGKSIKALAPKENANEEAKVGIKEADSDLKEAESTS